MISKTTYEFVSVYFLFTQYIKKKNRIYHHLMNHEFFTMQIRNDSNTSFNISHHITLDHVINEIAKTQCYQVDTETHNLTTLQKSSNHETFMHKLKFRYRHVFFNEVTVFTKTKQDKIALSKVVSEFSSIWQNIIKTVNVTEKNMMHISLMNDWQKIKLLIKIYSLSFKNKQVIDKTFNKLHDQEHMQWFNQVTSFRFSVFMIKKNKKFKVMIDIRELNKITVFDAYSLSQQKNIIAAIHKVRYISMIDVTVFFHQWLVHSQNQLKLAVNTHYSQEFFKVAIMKFHNSLSYIQHQADRLFKNLLKIKVYINDIVIRSETFKQHVVHLRRLFQHLIEKRISLKSIKAFINFLNVTLLDNVINIFELFITQNKIKIIKKLKFLVTVKQLEHYVNLTKYLKSKISHFTQIVKSL